MKKVALTQLLKSRRMLALLKSLVPTMMMMVALTLTAWFEKNEKASKKSLEESTTERPLI